MLLVLNYLTITWLLLQTLTYCKGNIHYTFFPSVSQVVTNRTFPATVNFESNSDVILVKCPSKKYRHSNVNDTFDLHDLLHYSELKFHTKGDIFVWTPTVYNVNKENIFICGQVAIKRDEENHMHKNWEFKYNWQSKPKPFEVAKREKISKTLPLPSNCSNDPTKVAKFTRDKQGIMKRVNINNGELKETDELPHPNKLYYYFLVPEENSIMEHVPPCAIIRAVNEKPKIKINGQEHPVSPNNNKIHVIKQETMTEVFNIKLELLSPDTPDFYKGEKILMKEMRYTKFGIENIQNTDEMIMDSFTLHQFKILKFTYNYPTIENDNVVEKIYYFGPMKDDYNFPNQDILYLANETSIQPNCTINEITYGYFDSLTYENNTIKLNEFINNKKDNFELSGDYIILRNNKTNMISLMCRYITLTGTVTLTQTFIKGKKVFMGKNEKGEDIYKILSETDGSEYEKKMADKKKEMESIKKSFIDKLIDYIGIGATYGLIGGISLFILIIIIIIILLCYFKSIKPRLIRKKIQKTYPNIFELWNDISKQKLEKYSQIGVKRDYVADREQCHDYKKTCEGFEEIFIDTTSLFNNELVKCYKDINGAITAYYIDKISPQKKYIISDGPSNNNINYFWELLYRENVKVIVAFIDIEDDYVNYWPKKSSQKYGNINVEFIKNLSANDISHLSIYHFQMTVDVERKIIMCQAPVRETVDDTYDMFYRYRVKVVILLVSKEEIDVLDKCHFKSYPDINKFVQSANYVLINRTSIIDKNSCFYEHDCELQHIATKKTLLLKLIQYMDWPNKNIPVDRKTLYGLYKRTVELCKNDYLVIQCSSGVGRSGTLAMIIHMIDTIDKENPFDPFKSLDFIRQHRYKGVQTISQFFLALCILYQHFKDEIKFVDRKLYDQFMELAQIVFDGEKLSYC
ncbi:Protein-tyrosine phosphatase,receptor/non-receptor type domain and Protein-tyrosine/Dual specificity phosphatase domain and Protein-tyrosine phosphatase, catalytic domain-containing protein [Strongyloides ratti]|uniref:Protein-tyrosine phosphatase,receptor/non-receptor type domain and Protein-tyrosine/Dual specificity phosphatase domain and Protein-tyrosine phosphatase, catalytic domain-containing protein n=1 Tax=Strongyloides ratti TaxID=34506 RepID=A0A090KVK0_STRRB|nr:Protein-tyrosine phosphatase,receptor/non-receptor type domain and Protein-tyrosine/Dual specificity phosphatase domain and Protein-tyrosine phosphatase, catalytic domain-containing protein [Strongyloides ratti]CEF61451.1 Protein-tyrosine phosphatase,receptor/non-receptor type domain and Protein-tyrosine/Dual specificity phosphatase domain and Protein-tyrosine phosphatase, catalytic domain-containing protein [Strongyloides ratti]